MFDAPIGVFDSGVGGISTLGECMNLLPKESFIYLADRSGAPYGNKTIEEIESRVFVASDVLKKEGVKAIVVACNTATNVGIKKLRETYELPFFGVEPAIKPAVRDCKKGNILLLLTCATAKQQKFLDLFEKYDNEKIIVSPQANLAARIENNIENIECLRGEVYCMLSKYSGIEGVVLGCTHYIFIRNLIEDYYGGCVKIFDGNAGVARHLKDTLEKSAMLSAQHMRSIKFMVL